MGGKLRRRADGSQRRRAQLPSHHATVGFVEDGDARVLNRPDGPGFRNLATVGGLEASFDSRVPSKLHGDLTLSGRHKHQLHRLVDDSGQANLLPESSDDDIRTSRRDAGHLTHG